jgi:Trk K+ transport system NAD-binding subunit
LVFFIVLTSVLLQGTSIPLVVRWLGLATPQSPKPRYPLEFEEGKGMDATLMDFIIPYNSGVIGKPIVAMRLPEESVITLIVRGENYVVPTGTTTLQAGDVLLIVLKKASIPEVNKILSTPKPEQIRREEITRLLSDRYGPEVQTEDFIVPFYPSALNQPIQTLGLRTSTGASIIAVYRDPEEVLVPQLDTVILPGDVLLLLGKKEELAAALRYFAERSKEKMAPTAAPPQAATASIADGSPISGCTLAEIGFREELGVLIVGIRRGEDQITNPGPGFRVQAGDVLYLWGPGEKIDEAVRRAGSG